MMAVLRPALVFASECSAAIGIVQSLTHEFAKAKLRGSGPAMKPVH